MGSGWAAGLLIGTVVLAGSSVQRLTGMGFALVTVPALALLLGPAQGVVLADCAAGAISAVGLVGGWRQVRPTVMLPLVGAAMCTVPAGSWVAARLPEPVLMTGVGALVCSAVLLVLLVLRGARVPALRGAKGAVPGERERQHEHAGPLFRHPVREGPADQRTRREPRPCQ